MRVKTIFSVLCKAVETFAFLGGALFVAQFVLHLFGEAAAFADPPYQPIVSKDNISILPVGAGLLWFGAKGAKRG